MENNSKDPIIRTMVIIIVGTIAFGLLFNLLTGGGNMDHMENMGGYGYGYTSIDGFLAGMLMLLVKFLMVVLIIAVVAGVAVWIWNTFFKNTGGQLLQTVNNDPVLKTISTVTIAILGIILLFALLGSFSGTGVHRGMEAYGGGFSAALSIVGLLIMLIKVLSFVLVISLILAIVAYVKKQYDTGALNFAKGTVPGGNPGAGFNQVQATDTSENSE